MTTIAAEQTPFAAARERRFRPLHVLLKFLRQRPLGAIGGVIIVLLIVVAIIAPVLAHYGYSAQNFRVRLRGPSGTYWMGTDQFGRDMYSRIVYGARTTVTVGFGAVTVSILVATIIGIVSAYYGGLTDKLLQRVVDIWLCFPGLVLLISIVAVIGAGVSQLTFAIGLLVSASFSRVVRSSALTVRNQPYIEAARSLGARDLRLMVRHILPNVVPTIIVIATAQLGGAILIESSLSFLGYGIPPPAPDWGGMLSGQGLQFFTKAPWLAIWPGVALALAVFGFNMLGDALRDALDPRLRGTR